MNSLTSEHDISCVARTHIYKYVSINDFEQDYEGKEKEEPYVDVDSIVIPKTEIKLVNRKDSRVGYIQLLYNRLITIQLEHYIVIPPN